MRIRQHIVGIEQKSNDVFGGEGSKFHDLVNSQRNLFSAFYYSGNLLLISLAPGQVGREVVLMVFLSVPLVVFRQVVGGGFRDWLRK